MAREIVFERYHRALLKQAKYFFTENAGELKKIYSAHINQKCTFVFSRLTLAMKKKINK